MSQAQRPDEWRVGDLLTSLLLRLYSNDQSSSRLYKIAGGFITPPPTPTNTSKSYRRNNFEMAVHRDGLFDEEENAEDNALFDEPMIDLDPDTPPHLRELGAACLVGNVEALRIAIDNLNGSINEAVEDGDTALHLVCLYGYLPCAQLLIERGANIEAKDEDGAIPLHDACAGGYTEVARLLFSSANDADCIKRMVETVDAEGDTPLHHAARGEHVDVIRLLLSYGASATKTNVYGKIPGELAEPDSEARRTLESAVNDGSCH